MTQYNIYNRNAVLYLCLLLVFLFTACGKDNSSGSNSTAQDPVPSVEAPTPENIQYLDISDSTVKSDVAGAFGVDADKLLVKDNFSQYYFYRNVIEVNLQQYLNDEFKYYIPVWAHESVDRLKVKVNDEPSNIAKIISKKEDIYFLIELNKSLFAKSGIDLALKPTKVTLTLIPMSGDRELTALTCILDFAPVYSGEITLTMSGDLFMPGGCAHGYCSPDRHKQLNNLTHRIRLESSNYVNAKNYDFTEIETLDQHMPPYIKERYDLFSIQKIRVNGSELDAYLNFSINKDTKILTVKAKN